MSRIPALAALAFLTSAAPAIGADNWQDYAYPQTGFTVQFPAPPTVTTGIYATGYGTAAPSTVYAVRQDGVVFTMTVADFTAAPAMDPQSAISDAIKTIGDAGDIKLDTVEHIDLQFGRELSVDGKDGSHASMAIFFVGRRLFILEGLALPPDPSAGSDRIFRFQQTLSFPGQPPLDTPAAGP